MILGLAMPFEFQIRVTKSIRFVCEGGERKSLRNILSKLIFGFEPTPKHLVFLKT